MKSVSIKLQQILFTAAMVLCTGGLAVHDTLKVPYDVSMAGILASLTPQLLLAPLAYWMSGRMVHHLEKKRREKEQREKDRRQWEQEQQQRNQQEARAQQARQQAREKEQHGRERARRQQEKQEEARRQQEGENQRKAKSNGTKVQDWWAVLGIAPDATLETAKQAYRSKIKQYHPDRVEGLGPEFIQLASQKSKELNAALNEAMHHARA